MSIRMTLTCLQKDKAYDRLEKEKLSTIRQCKKGLTEAISGKKKAGKGRSKVCKLWETIHGSTVSRRRVQLSRLLLVSCPHAEAYTYATRIGTNVIDDTMVDIKIPEEYIARAVLFAEAEVHWSIEHRGPYCSVSRPFKIVACAERENANV